MVEVVPVRLMEVIAGIALAHQLTMVTRNVREFERVPGLHVQNWYDI